MNKIVDKHLREIPHTHFTEFTFDDDYTFSSAEKSLGIHACI